MQLCTINSTCKTLTVFTVKSILSSSGPFSHILPQFRHNRSKLSRDQLCTESTFMKSSLTLSTLKQSDQWPCRAISHDNNQRGVQHPCIQYNYVCHVVWVCLCLTQLLVEIFDKNITVQLIIFEGIKFCVTIIIIIMMASLTNFRGEKN